MGAAYTLECDTCGHAVHTSGPWEFYRDAQGRRRAYGHPTPSSREAKESGIHGLSGELYCLTCDRTSDVILVEFKAPTSDTLAVWFGRCEPKDECGQEDAVRCPRCGGTDMILEPPEDREVTCPRCQQGKLAGQMDWIS